MLQRHHVRCDVGCKLIVPLVFVVTFALPPDTTKKIAQRETQKTCSVRLWLKLRLDEPSAVKKNLSSSRHRQLTSSDISRYCCERRPERLQCEDNNTNISILPNVTTKARGAELMTDRKRDQDVGGMKRSKRESSKNRVGLPQLTKLRKGRSRINLNI